MGRLIELSFCALTFLTSVTAVARTPEQQLADTVQGFYGWVLLHGASADKLAPLIKDVKGSTRFYLDTSTLDAYSHSFMQSGYFSADFPAAVARYYLPYQTQFATMSQAEFDQLAIDHRGPLMDVEDMDNFFCAQEYEYKKRFVRGMKLTEIHFNGDRATAMVVSPYQWKTPFAFVKINGRWLISGYCVYL